MINPQAFQIEMTTKGRVDFDHQQGFQCVDLPREWWYENGITNTGGVPTAISYWTNPPQAVLNACDRIESSAAQAGDTVILRTNGTAPGDVSGDGHIGQATGNINDRQVEILEQHGQGGANDGLGGNAIRTRFVDRSRVAGLYRIKASAAPAPQTPPAASVPSGKFVVLPASVSAWAAYRPGSALRKGTSDQVGTLDPAKFGGLKYEILQWVGDKAIIINTQSYGQVAIWVKGTDAQFVDDAPAPPSPVPVPAPPAPEPVAPTPIEWKTLYKFERLQDPLNVATNKDTHLLNLQYEGGYQNVQTIAPLVADYGFTAVGKATKLDDDNRTVFYMSGESFGDADTTGEPAFWQGVNTVDLKPAEVKPETPITEASSSPDDDESEKIEVKVNPPANPESWKTSYKTNDAGDYTALQTVTVHDLDEVQPDIELPKGAKNIHIAGRFIGPDKIEYWRTAKSAALVDPITLAPKKEDWRGIPVQIQDGLDADNKPVWVDVLEEDFSFLGYIDEEVTHFEESLQRDGKAIKKSLATLAGNVSADASWLAGRLKKRSNK